jgi:hypothetical protein
MLAGFVALGVAGWAQTAAAVTCADLNNDGKVNLADAVRLIQAVGAGPNAADCGGGVGGGTLACGDLDHNGAITISDVVIMLAQLTGNPTLFPLCQGAGTIVNTPSACTAGGGKFTVSGNVGSTQEWSANCPIYIDGLVFVQSGVTVTIDPGTTVVGVKNPTQNGGPTNISALIFQRGSKINAAGSPSQPIIMTSQPHFEGGSGNISDWGGLTINGAAPVNCPGGECLAEGLVGVPFGGSNPNDSSGKLEYVRVEFSGKELSPDNELNIITYNGVGAGTVLDHVQANVGFDDCNEWFGGTVNGKFIVSSACGDDLFDTQLGTVGKFQYYLGVYYNPTMQNAGNNGFEWDNNENGFDLLPRNAPKTCNVTLIGTRLQTNAIGENTEQASNFRRGTAGIVANTIAEHFRNSGWALNDNATATQACSTGQFVVEHSLLFDNGFDPGGAKQVKGTATSPCTPASWYAALSAVNPSDPTQTGTDPQLGADTTGLVYGTHVGTDTPTNVDQFIPSGSSPGVATVSLVNSLAMDCKTIDPFFDTTNYVGALRPGDSAANWLTTPWISFETQ